MARPNADKFTFGGDGVWLSEFRLLPAHPDWNAARRTTDEAFLIAFPRTTVAIRHEHRNEVVADPTSAVVYRPGQVYRRRLISATGDDCTILAVQAELFARAAQSFDVAVDARSYCPPFAAAAVGRASHMAIERIRRHVGVPGQADSDATTEELYWLVHEIVASGYESGHGRRRRSSTAHRELTEAVREEIGRDLASTRSLADLAQQLAVSPFHLVRVFRTVTGRPIHAYRTELRLRSSLPLIAGGMRLADVAMHVGFSSHAHLTDRFVRAYGTTPGRWRETSKNMEARGEGAYLA